MNEVAKENRRWLNPEAAADYLGMSKAFLAIDRMTRRHGIPFVRCGRFVKYDRGDLDDWMAAHREGTIAPRCEA